MNQVRSMLLTFRQLVLIWCYANFGQGLDPLGLNVLIQYLYEEYCAWSTRSGTADHITVVGDALTLYDAQGYIYIHKPLIYLNPILIGDLMAAITNHTLTEGLVTSKEYTSEIVQYVKKNCDDEEVNPASKLKDGLMKFVKTGLLSYSHVAPFLFRKTALARKDHAFAIDMFKEAGIICRSSLTHADERGDEEETKEIEIDSMRGLLKINRQ